MGLFGQGFELIDKYENIDTEADEELAAYNRISQTANQGICIFVEWATNLPTPDFEYMFANLSQNFTSRRAMVKRTIQEAYSWKVAIQLVTPNTA